jgi:hypothetical protein
LCVNRQLKSYRICQGCGVEFNKKNSSRNAGKYHSRECAFANRGTAWNRGKGKAEHAQADGVLRWMLGWKECGECRCVFYSGNANRRLCGAECEKARNRRTAKEGSRDAYLKLCRNERPCKCCGVILYRVPSNNKIGSRLLKCCEQCTKENAKQAKKANKAKRRARAKTNGPYESIWPSKVFKRDGWVCQLCNEPCDQDATVPEPKAATLDHIIPLAKGGTHTMNNMQCACFECNSRKGDNVDVNEDGTVTWAYLYPKWKDRKTEGDMSNSLL